MSLGTYHTFTIDSLWIDVARTRQHRVLVYLNVEEKLPKEYITDVFIHLTEDKLKLIEPQLIEATIKDTRWGPQDRGTFRRDFYPIKVAEKLYAVGIMDANYEVQGPMAWHFNLFRRLHPISPIWFFEERLNKWLTLCDGKWIVSIPEGPNGHWIGLTPRVLSENGCKAIESFNSYEAPGGRSRRQYHKNRRKAWLSRKP